MLLAQGCADRITDDLHDGFGRLSVSLQSAILATGREALAGISDVHLFDRLQS